MEKQRKHASIEDRFHDAEETDEYNGDNGNNPIKWMEEHNGINTRECMEGLDRLNTTENDGLCLSNDQGIHEVEGWIRPTLLYCSLTIQRSTRENNGQWTSYSIVIHVANWDEIKTSVTSNIRNTCR